MPERIQLHRTKGWRLPDGAVSVARPSRWGNPFTVDGARDANYEGTNAELRALCARAFGYWLDGDPAWQFTNGTERRERILADVAELRGKTLACWCPLEDELDNPVSCHADVLLRLSNNPETIPGR